MDTEKPVTSSIIAKTFMFELYDWIWRKNELKTHPGLFVHLALEVAEGPADFCHTFSFSVTAQRARFFLWYTDAHKSLSLNKLNKIIAWPDHTLKAYLFTVSFFYGLYSFHGSDLTCMLLNQSCWRMTSYLKRSNREKTSAFRAR